SRARLIQAAVRQTNGIESKRLSLRICSRSKRRQRLLILFDRRSVCRCVLLHAEFSRFVKEQLRCRMVLIDRACVTQSDDFYSITTGRSLAVGRAYLYAILTGRRCNEHNRLDAPVTSRAIALGQLLVVRRKCSRDDVDSFLNDDSVQELICSQAYSIRARFTAFELA